MAKKAIEVQQLGRVVNGIGSDLEITLRVLADAMDNGDIAGSREKIQTAVNLVRFHQLRVQSATRLIDRLDSDE